MGGHIHEPICAYTRGKNQVGFVNFPEKRPQITHETVHPAPNSGPYPPFPLSTCPPKQNIKLHHTNTALETMMDVTFVLEESGVTATVEVLCESNVAAAKEVACTALAVSPASVEMRIGTQVLEGTCRLQDTAFGAGVQVVLARRFADIKCPAEYSWRQQADYLSLSRCGTLCVYSPEVCVLMGECTGHVGGFDTETFDTAFSFKVHTDELGPPAISQCKTRCYLPCKKEGLLKVALPGGEVVRKVDGNSSSVFACGGVVVSQGHNVVSVYDEDLTLLRSLSHKWCHDMAMSDCGGWVITSSRKEKNICLWDVNTGEVVACVPADGWRYVALSRSASVFAVGEQNTVQLYDWSGAALRSVDVGGKVECMQFTPCGKYLVVRSFDVECGDDEDTHLHQYDVATMSCVHVIPHRSGGSFAISPCSRVVVTMQSDRVIVTRHLYPHNSE